MAANPTAMPAATALAAPTNGSILDENSTTKTVFFVPSRSQRNQKDQRIDYSLRLPNPYIRRVIEWIILVLTLSQLQDTA